MGLHPELHVLVVEDDDAAAEAILALLEQAGIDADVAYSGGEALEKAASRLPDAILLDLDLPDMQGYVVAMKLRKNPSTSRIRLIAVTGLADAVMKRVTEEAGFDHHLVKPVQFDDLSRVLG